MGIEFQYDSSDNIPSVLSMNAKPVKMRWGINTLVRYTGIQPLKVVFKSNYSAC